MHHAFETWNWAINRESPTLRELVTVSGWEEPIRIFPREFVFAPEPGEAIEKLESTRMISIENICQSWMNGSPAVIDQ